MKVFRFVTFEHLQGEKGKVIPLIHGKFNMFWLESTLIQSSFRCVFLDGIWKNIYGYL
jgi:hypothetical protein